MKTFNPATSNHRYLEQHRRLEQVFTALVKESEREDPIALRRQWTAFETELLAHLTEEESCWLPGFSRRHPGEADEILREHRAIRANLTELGVLLDLHALRADAVEEFVTRLREHAAREDRCLYPWIAEHEATRGPSASPTY